VFNPPLPLNVGLIFLPQSIDAQWITAKKDWREAKKRRKTQQEQSSQPPQDQNGQADGESNGTYEEYMDEMRCILYIHGGRGMNDSPPRLHS
jgi:hypothetical protein